MDQGLSLLEKFKKYIGPVDSLRGYSRSYKLIFFKTFFDLADDNGCAFANKVSEAFRNFYVKRKQQGKISDKDVEERIANIEKSTVQDVYHVILNNPFKHISDNGFMYKKSGPDGSEQFCLVTELAQKLSLEDIDQIKQLVDKKIAFYFSRIDNDSLQLLFERILNEYVEVKTQSFAKNPMGTLFRVDIVQAIYESGLVDRGRYLVKGSIGQGNWATVPWVCIFDRRITESASKGVYIVYLLSQDGTSLYLTLNQGCTDLKAELGKKNAIKEMRETAKNIIECIDSHGFYTDDGISLGENPGELGELYEKGCIFYKRYERGNVPTNQVLLNDLEQLIGIYEEYYRMAFPELVAIDENSEEVKMTIKDSLVHIKKYIAAKGFSYTDGLIENFYLSLKAKPFVILAGTSGTGKTRLVKLFAEAIGATNENGRYQLVSVRPDWSDSSDLFGHVDLNGCFVPGNIINFVKEAESHISMPYFLCLDEMNLARVEYYLSDVLSIIETRDLREDGRIITDPLISETYYGPDKQAASRYKTIRLPENLYIVGTVNMDETTFPFSRKVLDRANTIEFSFVDLTPHIFDDSQAELPLTLGNEFLKTRYLLLNQCKEEKEFVYNVCSELQVINKILLEANAHVGYRVRDEIVFYLLNNRENDLISQDEAMDYEIMQKILPRIQGNSSSVKNMLCELFKFCAGDYEGYQTKTDDISSKMMKKIETTDCKYLNSAKKIAFMMRRYEDDGFTSYWL